MLQKLVHPSFPVGATVPPIQAIVGIGPVAKCGGNDSTSSMPHHYQSFNHLGREDHVQFGAEEVIDPVLHPVFNLEGLPLAR